MRQSLPLSPLLVYVMGGMGLALVERPEHVFGMVSIDEPALVIAYTDRPYVAGGHALAFVVNYHGELFVLTRASHLWLGQSGSLVPSRVDRAPDPATCARWRVPYLDVAAHFARQMA